MEPSDDEKPGRLNAIEGLARLNRLRFTNLPVEDKLDRIAHLGRRTIPHADQVSITLIDGNHPHTVVFTGDIARQLDERQYHTGYGPCTDAALSGRTIAVALTDPGNLYRDFSTAGRRLGILNTLSVALPVPDRIVGGMNIYSSNAQPFDSQAVQLAEVFASYAAVCLMNGHATTATSDFPDDVLKAFRTRTIIETAKGVLMARNFYSAREAFEELQRRAAAEHRPIPQIAQDVVNGVQTTNTDDQTP